MQPSTPHSHPVMDSASGMPREGSVTSGPTDNLSSPRPEAQESQSLPPPVPPPLSDSDRDPSPLPRWLQLRVKASWILNRSRRHDPGNVVVLPFNKIAKLNVSVTEIAALNFVGANTSIPVPKSKLSKTSVTILHLHFFPFSFSVFISNN